MKNILFILLLSLISVNLLGLAVDKHAAKDLATYWMERNSDSNREFIISDSFEMDVSGTTCLYFFNFEGGGFVIMSADDISKPILGYAFDGAAIQNPNHPTINWFMKDLAEQVHYAVQYNLTNQEYMQEWRVLTEQSFIPHTRDRNVTPLMSCNWNQDYSWNLLCPSDNSGPGGHVYVGCVAVSMAQIMYYWEYPTTSTGSHGYTHPEYGYLFEDFGNYNFNTMNNSSATTQSRTLLYHCGVAVNMDYGPDGSGAFTNYAENAFRYYFDYSLETQMYVRGQYEQNVWEEMLRVELEAGRPLYYAGQGSQYGHAFNIDGYQNTNYFHLNWGWSGYQNGYFYINNLNGFNSGQEAIMGIQPPETATAPYGLTAQVYGTDVLLSWINPGTNRDVTGYRIYRNDVQIAVNDGADLINYYDMAPGTGQFTYYVTAMYSEAGESAGSNNVIINFATDSDEENVPNVSSRLIQNYPNPFNPSTTISYNIHIEENSNSKIVIYNAKGQRVEEIDISENKSGKNEIVWNAKKFTSGIYFYKLINNGNLVDSKKMILMK
jgi:hypothetical protein